MPLLNPPGQKAAMSFTDLKRCLNDYFGNCIKI